MFRLVKNEKALQNKEMCGRIEKEMTEIRWINNNIRCMETPMDFLYTLFVNDKQ